MILLGAEFFNHLDLYMIIALEDHNTTLVFSYYLK